MSAYRLNNLNYFKKIFYILLFGAVISLGFATNSYASERQELVQAADTVVGPLIKLFVNEQKKLSPDEEGNQFLNRLLDVLNGPELSLVFTDHLDYFNIKPGEPTRLMSTNPTEEGGNIYVNTIRLSEDNEDQPIDLSLILFFLFHEYAHKTQFKDYGYRDNWARKFQEFFAPFIKTTELDEDSHLVTLSVPISLLDIKVAKVSINLPQPSFLILGEHAGSYTNFTPEILADVEAFSSNTRNIWSETNRVLYLLGNSIGAATNKVMAAINNELGTILESIGNISQLFGAQNQGAVKLERPFANIDLDEIRKLEILEAVYQRFSNDQIAILIRGQYKIDRSGQKSEVIEFSEPHEHNKTLPVVFRALVKIDVTTRRLILQDHNLALSTNVDFLQTAKVGQIIRNSEEVSIKIKVPKQKDPRLIFLNAQFAGGHISLPADSVMDASETTQEAIFKIPKYILSSPKKYYADSVTLDTEKIALLNRIVELNPENHIESEPNNSTEESIEIVPNTPGIWISEGDRKQLKTDFSHLEPIILFYLLDPRENKKYIQPQNVQLEFQISRQEHIYEVRFHFSRTINIIRPDESNQVADFSGVSREMRRRLGIDEDLTGVILGNGGTYVTGAVTQEVAVAPGKTVSQSMTDDPSIYKVQTQFRIPFYHLRGLEPGEAYLPPMITPHSIEVVLASGKTLVYNFSQILDEDKMACSFSLTPARSAKK